MALLAITLFLLTAYGFLIQFYYYHWRQLPTFVVGDALPDTLVSVIVAARNEEKNIAALLGRLTQQNYPKHLLEIIVVDDFSTDNTKAVAERFLQQSVTVIQPPFAATASSKKKAIEAGVQQAKGKLLLVTDADCMPPLTWVRTVAAFQHQNKSSFIAAPVKFTYTKKMVSLFQAIDFITLQGITAASVQASFLSMCNGANLAYTKKAFQSVNGFAGIDNIASGDDMLLMYKVWTNEKDAVHYVKSKDAIVTTAPMPTWKDFLRQRKRWASKTTYYDDKRMIVVLLFIYMFNCWFFVLLAATFLNVHTGWWLLIYLAVKTLVEWPFVQSVAKFYGDEKLMRYFAFFQPLHIVYTVAIGIISQTGRYEWKGRKTK